jgi:hypothetical protein
VRIFQKAGKPCLDELLSFFGCEPSHVRVSNERAVHVTVAGDASFRGKLGNAIDAHFEQVSNPELQRHISATLTRRSGSGDRRGFALIVIITIVIMTIVQGSGLILGRNICP